MSHYPVSPDRVIVEDIEQRLVVERPDIAAAGVGDDLGEWDDVERSFRYTVLRRSPDVSTP